MATMNFLAWSTWNTVLLIGGIVILVVALILRKRM
jgi:hypothetical protein